MIYEVTINCLSDACIGSGTAIGVNVDADVCATNEGFPYIPAKRIKGLLKEAFYDYIDITNNYSDEADRLFGTEGKIEGSLRFTNAYIQNYKPGNYNYSAGLIKSTYTKKKIMTAIDDNTKNALDSSLRVMEVVNKGTKFVFEISSPEKLAWLNDVIKMVRHTGVHRNRGLGEIELSVIEKNQQSTKPFNLSVLKDDKSYILDIKINNVQPLLLTAEKNGVTESYISGNTLSGAFGTYVYNNKNVFNNLFIEGKVKFSNAYPSDKNYSEFFPAPFYVLKEKNTGSYVNSFAVRKEEQTDDAPSRKLKPISNTYLSIKDDTIKLSSLDYDYIYHHHRDEEQISKGTIKEFYQYYTVRENQYFLGHISGLGKDLKTLVLPSIIFLGKSRTAQYGRCIVKYDYHELTDTKVQGDKFVITALSDLKIKNQNGIYTNDIDEIFEAISNSLKISKESIVDHSIKFGSTGGYNMTWKCNKPVSTTIKAGSYFVVDGKNNLSKNTYVGDDSIHGYGSILIEPFKSMKSDTYINVSSKSSEYDKLNDNIRKIVECKFHEEFLKKEAFLNVKKYISNNKEPQNYPTSTQINKAISILRNSTSFDDFNDKISKNDKDLVNPSRFKKRISAVLGLENNYNEKNDYKIYYNYFLICLKYHGRLEEE